ncbi:MAG: DNA-binding response regulator [Desulfovibrio sp.]|nr:MAG: DNA-binding response regulator [Desulfovibrio sp.]
MARLVTLIVHPDPQVRETMRSLLEPTDLLRVLGEAVSSDEVLELLEAVPYGVLFLGVDIKGDLCGFDLARKLMARKNRPALVFIARDEGKAFDAFELGATDYLLWPVTPERLQRTFERLKQFKAHFKLIDPSRDWKDKPAPGNGEEADEEREQTLQLPLGEEEEEFFLKELRQAWDFNKRLSSPVEIEKLAINLDGKAVLVPYNQIIFVEAFEDYSYVHTANQKFLTSYRLKVLEDRLRHHRFFRVHRKYLVNLDMVTEVASLPGSNFMLRTAGRTRIELPISRRRIGQLKQILGL